MKERTPSFLSIGECMLELAPVGGDPELYKKGFAGDTFNTAWYARRLLPEDWSVGYCTWVGDDQVSSDMRGFFRQEGIDTASIRTLPAHTIGLYMIHLHAGERSFSYWRGQSAARQLASDPDWLAEQVKDRDVIFFSGITMAILSPQHRTNLCNALTKARSKGAMVAFDTNLRPRLWSGREEMKRGLIQGASVANVVLPSFDEETALFGDKSPSDTIDRYRDAGSDLVVVKNGEAPLTVWGKNAGTFSYAPRKAETVDSTAAGDSFAAGLLSALAAGKDLKTAVRQASDVAAQVVQARGALTEIELPAGE